MNKATVYIVIIILVLVSVSTIIYFKYELPRRLGIEGEFSNLSISAKYDGKFVEAVLIIQNGENKEIKTREGYEFLEIKKGVYEIYCINSSEIFYKAKKTFNITKDITRIDFELEKPKEVRIKSKENGSIINLEIYSENYQNAKVCLKHSLNYIFVNTEKEEIDLLDGYKDWDKCYSLDKSIKGSEFLNVSYKVFGIPNEDDYIKIAVIDTEYIKGSYRNQLDGVDLGGKDQISRIK